MKHCNSRRIAWRCTSCAPAILSFIVLLWASLLAASESHGPGLSLRDRKLCELYLLSVQQGSLGTLDDPVAELRQKYPGINDPAIEFGLYQFESDVLHVFELTPEHRNLAELAKRWSLSESQLLDALTYYGTQVFYNDVRIAGDVQTVFRRLQAVSFEHFLRFSDHSAAKRFGYYITQVTKLSAPEMARELGITEGEVYRDLSLLQISIVSAFEQSGVLTQARELVVAGKSMPEIARQLGVGEQALRFVLHSQNDLNRGVGWERVANVNGVSMLEIELLVKLHSRGDSAAEIAERLNSLFQTSPNDIDVRTEASVRGKLAALGLTEKAREASFLELYHPEYGYLKQSGKLVVTSALKFIFDYYDRPDTWIADQLGIEISSLREFYVRHHVVRLIDKSGRPSFRVEPSVKTAALLNRYEKQRRAIDLVLNWIVAHGGALPVRTDFGMGPDKVGMAPRVFALPTDDKAAFTTTGQAWLAIKREGARRGINIELLNLRIDDRSEEVRAERRKEALGRIVSWLESHHGKALDLKVFKEMGLEQGRLFGTGDYASGRKYSASSIFSSSAEVWLAIREAAKAKGIFVSLLEGNIRSSSDELVTAQRQEVADRILAWADRHKGMLPAMADFSREEDGVGLVYARLTNPVSSGNKVIFASASDLWLTVKREAGRRGKAISLLNQIRITKPSEELRQEWRKEAIEITLEWMRTTGQYRIPLWRDFERTGQGGLIPVSPYRLYGLQEYDPQHGSSQMWLFPSREAFEHALIDAAAVSGIVLQDAEHANLQKLPPRLIVRQFPENKGMRPQNRIVGAVNYAKYFTNQRI